LNEGEGVNTHLGRVNTHLGRVNTHLGRVNTHLGRDNTHLGRVNTHLGRVNTHLGYIHPGRVTSVVNDDAAHLHRWEACLRFTLAALRSEGSRRVRCHLVHELTTLATTKSTKSVSVTLPGALLDEVRPRG
jgi:hypothetical protein